MLLRKCFFFIPTNFSLSVSLRACLLREYNDEEKY